MNLLREVVRQLTKIPIEDLIVNRDFYQANSQKITHWYDRNEKGD